MRYLTTYKIFESKSKFTQDILEDITSTVKDILLEISDLGFNVDIESFPVDASGHNSVFINNYRESLPSIKIMVRMERYVDGYAKTFDCSQVEIKEVFDRSVEYLNSLGYDCKIEWDYYNMHGRYGGDKYPSLVFQKFMAKGLGFYCILK